MKPERFQTIRETAEGNIPKELRAGSTEYRFLSPWLFVRRDLFRGVWRDPWYRQSLGYSRNRLFRDTWIRKAPLVEFPTRVDCIRVKRVSVRYFDRSAGRVWKVLATADEKERAKLASDLAYREKFARVGTTIPVLSSGEGFFVEPISSGRRILEQEFLKRDQGAAEMTRIVRAIGQLEPLREEDEVLTAGCHGDLMIHNLFWNPEENEFIVIDWEGAGRGPVLWDSFLFFYVLLKKKAVRRSSSLLRRFDLVAAEHFREVVNAYLLDHRQVTRQWEACIDRFDGARGLGRGERINYGDSRVNEDLRRLKRAVLP